MRPSGRPWPSATVRRCKRLWNAPPWPSAAWAAWAPTSPSLWPILIDFDRVDLANLNRQQYKVCQIGQPKVQALSENLLEIAPYLEILAHDCRITEENFRELLAGADVICEAFDNPESKAMLVNGVLEQLPGTWLVAGSGMAGMDSPNTIRTRRISKRFYLCGDGVSDVQAAGTLFAARVMVCAAHQAHTIIRILAGQYDV